MKDKERELPAVFSPEEVAAHFGWSPRRLRAKAREIGACRVLGNRMVLTAEDVDAILEASRWRSGSSIGMVTGKSRVRSKGSDTREALNLLRKIERR
ncbi:hypothetical protein QTA58_00095 [Neorhizobium sp. CSC1952]|uniref:hypothetical protein n=1 Tax=Neorhizobium sp. CSC1952 TaxID=2978974 RepID=UPI0025A523C7|nr:hypothetical protein [Rhizobium sp. CSC1952]WJR67180.1 hypothetical protein QTA58_23875 [Rhizobium sp. CSC1952]WJR67209.1 hypothetical protein QTA58_00095 [Rhizobium sp. CSC1952]